MSQNNPLVEPAVNALESLFHSQPRWLPYKGSIILGLTIFVNSGAQLMAWASGVSPFLAMGVAFVLSVALGLVNRFTPDGFTKSMPKRAGKAMEQTQVAVGGLPVYNAESTNKV